jgi:hypothetical protein
VKRLHEKYTRLVFKGKLKQKAVTAAARELAGFIWGAHEHGGLKKEGGRAYFGRWRNEQGNCGFNTRLDKGSPSAAL